jgi:hypothetical protein
MSDQPTAPQPTTSAPRPFWEGVLTGTPVVLTVLSTLLAGLSSTEMSLAQYHRALSAQHQAKTVDQWSFFQAKRGRAAGYDTAVDGMIASASAAGSAPLPVTPQRVSAELGTSAGANAVTPEMADALTRIVPPFPKLKGDVFEPASAAPKGLELTPVAPEDGTVATLMEAVRRRLTEDQTRDLVGRVDPTAVADSLRAAEYNANSFDEWSDRIDVPLSAVDALLRRHAESAAASGDRGKAESASRLRRDWIIARDTFLAWRYRIQANFNMRSALLYEVQVRRSSWESAIHIRRCWGYWYGQLAVQAAVTVATMSLAVRSRSLLWAIAAAASLAGVGYSAGVYLNSVPVPGA